MQVELHLQPAEIIAIFEQADIVDIESRLQNQAYAPKFSQIDAWVGRLWSDIEMAIKDAVNKGKDEINRWIERIQEEIEEVRTELGDSSEVVLSVIGEKLAERCQSIREAMLKLLPTTLTIKNVNVGLSTVGLEYEIEVKSEVVASLVWALNIAAGSTFTVSATYAIQST